jgi:hypothetical protein
MVYIWRENWVAGGEVTRVFEQVCDVTERDQYNIQIQDGITKIKEFS